MMLNINKLKENYHTPFKSLTDSLCISKASYGCIIYVIPYQIIGFYYYASNIICLGSIDNLVDKKLWDEYDVSEYITQFIAARFKLYIQHYV
jgi:hypothetical protein